MYASPRGAASTLIYKTHPRRSCSPIAKTTRSDTYLRHESTWLAKRSSASYPSRCSQDGSKAVLFGTWIVASFERSKTVWLRTIGRRLASSSAIALGKLGPRGGGGYCLTLADWDLPPPEEVWRRGSFEREVHTAAVLTPPAEFLSVLLVSCFVDQSHNFITS